MTVWFTSDTHFSHANILHLGKGRPFDDIWHHNEMLIKNWNDRVMPDDIVFHLGDVAMGPWPEGLNCVKRLAGYKILVPGNHDRISSVASETRRKNFEDDYWGAFDDVYEEVEFIDVQGTTFGISHYPYDGDSHDKDRFDDIRAQDNGTPLIHGHTHAQEKVSRSNLGTLQISVGVDAWDFRPVHEDEVMEILRQES